MTLPLLLPLLSAALVVRGIATFNQFYLFWIMGPNGNDYTLPTLGRTRWIRFDPFLYSVAAAVNIVSVVALGGDRRLVPALALARRARGVRVSPPCDR